MTSKMQHPFQCIASVQPEGQDGFLIAACGPNLISLSLTTGEILSEWSAEKEPPAETNGKPQEEPPAQPSEPPSKRQKTSNNTPQPEEEEEALSKPSNPPSSKKKSKQPKMNASPPKSTTIILITISPDHQHMVAVTDDKSIRVFSLLPTIQELGSPRQMPKRSCAVQISPSTSDIFIADKHGDVYALPLLQGEAIEKASQPETKLSEARQFKPSATPLTVHSKRNLTALQAQQAQKQFTPRKDVLADFENSLLLGHVSMLTDMKILTLEGDKRQWIATCDRDEHIRLSRAPPQSHVIEGFCLGHQAFVSRICQVGTKLVSGGGDSWLGVWDFRTMKLERKVPLLGLVVPPEEGKMMAVSGIWKVGEGVLFTVEKVEAVFWVPSVDVEGGERVFDLGGGAPLDLVVLGEKVVVSVDAREGGRKRLLVIDLKTGTQDYAFVEKLAKLNAYAGKEISGTGKELDALLYNMANLRKRGPLEGGEEDGAAGETTIPEEE